MMIRKLGVAAVLVTTMWAFGAQAQGIDGSRHDLGSGNVNAADRNEICVYCHTPHASNTDVPEVPLWNKLTPVSTGFQTYDSTTIDGTILAVGSVSLACLSCHDGTQAMDVVINGPTVGATGWNYDPAGVDLGTQGTIGTNVTNLTKDLRNDHPIGVQYGGFGTPQIDPDFKTTGSGLQTATINGASRWWVDTEGGAGNAQRNKTDMILYTRSNAGTDQPFVECASCHDPHNAGSRPFLRLANANSAVCLACHVK